MGLRSNIKEALRNKRFSLAVDLGCGPGRFGELFKPHCDTLIGVDKHLGRLSVAKKFSGYDQVVWCDIREYELPLNTDAIFMLEVIEHISKADGLQLLRRILHVPFIILSTPIHFHKFSTANHHVSLWTVEELEEFGFKTTLMSYTSLPALLGIRTTIFAVKEA